MLLNKLHAILFLYLTSAIILHGNLPELSSIDPIKFDEVTQKLVASNEAIFEFKDIRLKADQINFYKKYNLLNAEGNIHFAFNNNRLITNDFALDLKSGTFSLDQIKCGSWPYNINAKNGGGNSEEMNFYKGILYYGDPHPLTPNLKAKVVTIFNDDNRNEITFKKALLRIGNVPIFYFPKLNFDLDNNSYLVNTQFGYENELGLYAKSLYLLPLNNWLKVGFNLDFYSKRGTLIGPAIQYYNKNKHFLISGALSSGFIDDDEPPKKGISIDPTNKDRSFILAQHKQIYDNKLFLTFQSSNLSDSEVTRDFREKNYKYNQFPLNFFEVSYLNKHYGVSAYSHFENDEFSQTRERIPDINLYYLPNKVFNTSLYHHANFSYAKIHEGSINPRLFKSIDTLSYNVLGINYGLYSTYHYNNWLKISPKLEYRGFEYTRNSNYKNILTEVYDQNYNFLLYSLGFESQYQATYPTQNKLWKINGLRHIFKPSLAFTNIQSLNSPVFESFISNERNELFLFSKPSANFLDYRNLEDISELFVTRLSFDNYFQTRRKTYGSRDIMELNFIADFYSKYKNRNINDSISGQNALWLEFNLNPAPWLKFEMASRLKNKSFNLVENYQKLTLKSSLFWEFGLRSYFKETYTNQVVMDFLYKMSENTHLKTILWADLKNNNIPRYKFCIDKIVNSTWKTSYTFNYRKDNSRGDDLSLNINLELISY